LAREIDRLQMRLGGIRSMKSLPALVFVVDVRRKRRPSESNLLGIPVVAIVDTNCDPTATTSSSNDDAIRAIKLLREDRRRRARGQGDAQEEIELAPGVLLLLWSRR
jgi:small subunit ribosomal protein S2